MKNQGFTLIELVVVVVLLGILAATALPRFVDLSGSARKAANQAFAAAFQSGIHLAVSTQNMQSPGRDLIGYGGSAYNIGFGGGRWPMFANTADSPTLPLTVPAGVTNLTTGCINLAKAVMTNSDTFAEAPELADLVAATGDVTDLIQASLNTAAQRGAAYAVVGREAVAATTSGNGMEGGCLFIRTESNLLSGELSAFTYSVGTGLVEALIGFSSQS